nr:helix-turn-helix domain-containing protein [Ornithinimicrobium sediminis]
MENDTMVKTGAVAELLGVSRQHVVDLCTRGDLPSIR